MSNYLEVFEKEAASRHLGEAHDLWDTYSYSSTEVDLSHILQVVTNLGRSCGLPKDVSIDFPKDLPGEIAGATDHSKKRIYLNRHLYDWVSPEKRRHVYYGVGLHEVHHYLESTLYFSKVKGYSDEVLLWLINLLEDERIERILTAKSPGYSGYIETAKEELFDDIRGIWKVSEDVDKILALVFCCIRCPDWVPGEIQDYLYKGHCVYDDILEMLPESFTALSVFSTAKTIYDYLITLLDIPAMKMLQSKTYKLIKQGLEDYDIVKSAVLPEEYSKIHDEKISEISCCGGTRQVKLDIASPDIPHYMASKLRINKYIRKFREIIKNKVSTHSEIFREKVRGKIDRNRLGKATVSKRIFSTREEVSYRGLSLCVILDASGSMGTVVPIVRDCAVLFTEGLKGLPGIDFELYSHSSCGTSHYDCLVTYLYGQKQPVLAGVGSYCSWAENYDSIAIKYIGDRFLKVAQYSTKVMFVLCDGLPQGRDYGGASAVSETHAAVEYLESKRVLVVGIGIGRIIGKYTHLEKIYSHVIYWTDMNSLVSNMAFLLKTLIRQKSLVNRL